jgi:hypothetical protein
MWQTNTATEASYNRVESGTRAELLPWNIAKGSPERLAA